MQYEIKHASLVDIAHHLSHCDPYFMPPLSERVNIQDYSRKLFEKSITFEAWDDSLLVGLVAIYLSEGVSAGFVSNISVNNAYTGQGIATKLVTMSIEYAMVRGYKELELEVDSRNEVAIKIYSKLHFVTVRTTGTKAFMRLGLNLNDIQS